MYFSAILYTKTNGETRPIIVWERAIKITSSATFEYVTGLHSQEYQDACELHDFTPKYVQSMPEAERKEKFWYSAPHHTHTRVYDLENKGWRTLIKDKICYKFCNYDACFKPGYLHYFPRKEILDPDDATDFEAEIKQFYKDFLLPNPDEQGLELMNNYNGYDEEVEGETILLTDDQTIGCARDFDLISPDKEPLGRVRMISF